MGLMELEPGLVVDGDSGEILEIAEGIDPLLALALARHDAKEQEEAWKRRRIVADVALLARQEEKRAQYANVLVTVMQRTYEQTDAVKFADELAGAAIEWPELMAVIAAAKGFKRGLLPEKAVEAFRAATVQLPTKPWIESQVVLRRAG
jgi:hypothetical protein